MAYDNFVVGQIIRDYREKVNKTQDTLSGLAGIARTHWTMIENGVIIPKLNTIWKIANALDIEPSQLIKAIEEELRKIDGLDK